MPAHRGKRFGSALGVLWIEVKVRKPRRRLLEILASPRLAKASARCALPHPTERSSIASRQAHYDIPQRMPT